MKKISLLKFFVLSFSFFVLLGCGTTTTTKTTDYDKDGKVTRVTEVSADTSDFSAFLASSDGCATTLAADVTKFNLGWNGYGLNWFSVSGVRVKAPTDTADELKKTAEIIKATKLTLQTSGFGVNTEKGAEAKESGNKARDSPESESKEVESTEELNVNEK